MTDVGLPTVIAGRHSDRNMFRGVRQSHTHGTFNEGGTYDDANSRLQRMIGEFVAKKFPGHPWAVFAEVEHGIVKVGLQGFLQWCCVIKIDELKSDPHLDTVHKYAGELLERLAMPRRGFSLADWHTASRRLPMHLMRNKLPDKVIG